MELFSFIRKKSREEWQELALERWTDVRIWIHEHGMQSLLLGLVSGLVIALAFRLIMGIAIVGGLLIFCAWQYALPQAEQDALRAREQISGSNGPDKGQSL